MNFYNIFGEIEKADPEVYSRLDTRRGAMKKSLHHYHGESFSGMPAPLPD